jgi:lipoprotein-anchoring transpeptidase ErfK/SrfK
MVKTFLLCQFFAASTILGGWMGLATPAIASPLMQIRPFTMQASELPLPALETFSHYQPTENQPTENEVIRLVLRLRERQLYVYEGQKAIASYPVAIGRPSAPTPTGEFRVFEMLKDPSWQNPITGEVETPGEDGSLGTRWIGFANLPNGVIGFHGTPNRASIGRAVSHGCVRMRNEDVEALFQQIVVGTVVNVES